MLRSLAAAALTAAALLLLQSAATAAVYQDWLVQPPTTAVTLEPWSSESESGPSGLTLSNGLISRRFALVGSDSWATWDFISHLEDSGDTSLLRSLTPESVVTLDGKAYPVGGLVPAACSGGSGSCKAKGQPGQPGAFFNRSVAVKPDPDAFRYVSHRTAAPTAPFAWKPGSRGSPPDAQWPPHGLHLEIDFAAPLNASGTPVVGVGITVHYEMYVGHPVLTKWVSVSTNRSAASQHRHHHRHAAPVAAAMDPCSGFHGCGECAGTVYMRACGAVSKTPKESQAWHYDAANKSLLNGGMCLSSAGANTGGSAGCPHLAVCNATLAAQRWELDRDSTTNSGWLRTLDPSTCSGSTPPGCGAIVTGNRKDAGAWWNVNPCQSEPSQMQFALVGTHLVNSDSMLCAAATPHAGPAPAPPPGPAPSPPPSTVATLQQIEVETLALNQPYSPMPYEAYIQPTSLGPDAISPTGPDPRYKGDGKLHIELEYEYSDEVRWGFEPTEYAGASEPTVSTMFDPPLSTPVPSTASGGSAFVSFKTYLLVMDDGPEQGGLQNPLSASSENDGGCSLGPCTLGTGTQSEQGVLNERAGLARRKLLRLLAPQIQECPIFFHLTSTDETVFDSAIEQMAATGFDMVIFSFGSGFKLESADPAYIAIVKANVAKAKAHGIEVGAYDLIGWTRNSEAAVPGSMALAADGHSLGSGACWASSYADYLMERVDAMANLTGLSMIETDGPYGGYGCSNSSHIHHHGEADSVYMQVRGQGDFYRKLRDRGIFINAPDDYFFQGTNKEGIGYNENQFSLPRAQQLVITRTTLYENTFIMPPTAGWSFVPLIAYHAGGNAASFWPPSTHLQEYELAIAMHMSFGVGACYRGPGLYDTPHVRDMVKSWVSWFKLHRRILTADIIHLRRPDGQSIDGIVHVDPRNTAGEIALAAFFNPTLQHLNTTIMLALYYAGVRPGGRVNISRAEPIGSTVSGEVTANDEGVAVGGGARGGNLVANDRSRVGLQLAMAPGSYVMLLIKHAK